MNQMPSSNIRQLHEGASVPLPITSLLAGVCALLMVPLSLQVSLRRIQLEAASPAGGRDETLRRRIRAHGNFIEYAPTAIIVVGLVEYAGASRSLTLGLAAAFLASRVVHAVGMLYSATPTLRATAMLIQHAAFLVSGAWLIRNVLA